MTFHHKELWKMKIVWISTLFAMFMEIYFKHPIEIFINFTISHIIFNRLINSFGINLNIISDNYKTNLLGIGRKKLGMKSQMLWWCSLLVVRNNVPYVKYIHFGQKDFLILLIEHLAWYIYVGGSHLIYR